MEPVLNRNFLLIIIFFWCVSCQNTHKEYYTNGTLKQECFLEKPNWSVCDFYDENGKLIETNQFSDDKKTKVMKLFFLNGTLNVENRMEDGKLVYSKTFDAAGIPLNECDENNTCRFFEYYKNKKLYKINYLVKLIGDTSGVYKEDSTITYSMKTGQKILSTKRLPALKSTVISIFSQQGKFLKSDTIADFNEYNLIVNSLLNSDTLEIQYQPQTFPVKN